MRNIWVKRPAHNRMPRYGLMQMNTHNYQWEWFTRRPFKMNEIDKVVARHFNVVSRTELPDGHIKWEVMPPRNSDNRMYVRTVEVPYEVSFGV